MDAQPLRTVLAALPRTTLMMAKIVGLDTHRLMQAARLTPEALEHPEGRIPVSSYADLWRALAEDPESHKILLPTKGISDLSVVGVVGYVMGNSPTIAAAFSAYDRHRRIVGDFVDFQAAASPEGFALTFTIPSPFYEIPLFAEGTVVLNHALMRVLCGRDVSPLAVHLSHGSEKLAPSLPGLVGHRFVFHAPHTTIVYPLEVASWPVVRADPMLFHFIERHATAVREQIPDSTGWADRIRRIVLAQLEKGEPAQSSAAKLLAVSERTLQRRLGEENTSFVQIVDECRRNLALRYIGDRSLGLGEIAFLLGYSEQSAFHRAFRRWTGRTPAEARQIRLAG